LKLIQGIIDTAMKLLSGDWEGAWNTIKDTLASIWKSITDALGETVTKVWEDAKKLGADVVRGIIEGIKSLAAEVGNALINVLVPGYNTARDAIQSKSPSKLFADGVGAPISEGIAVGILEKGHMISESLTQVVQFAKDSKLTKSVIELASGVIDLFKDTISLYADLAKMEMTTDSAGLRQKLLTISYLIRDAVLDFWNRMREIPQVLKDPKALGIADAVHDVISTVSEAVDAFIKLKDFEGIPRESIAALMRGIQQAVRMISEMSTHFEIEGLEQTARFATLAEQILAPIKTAMDAFDGLRTYEDVASRRMRALAADMRLAIDLMQVLSLEFDLEGLTATAQFSADAKIIFEAIKSGVDALDGIREYQGIPKKRFHAFLNDFLTAVQLMVQLKDASGVFLTQTLEFAHNMETIAKAIKDSVDAIKNLGTINLSIQANASFGGDSADVPKFAAGGLASGLIQAGEEGFEFAQKGSKSAILTGGYYNVPSGTRITSHDRSVEALGLARDNAMLGRNTEWNIDAHYTQFQSETDLMDDVRTLSILNKPS